jgi:hypothetical protein
MNFEGAARLRAQGLRRGNCTNAEIYLKPHFKK